MPANNLTSNTTSKIMRAFTKGFEMNRVLTKSVNSSLFSGQFTPQFGDTVKIKRPHQFLAKRTATGDISGGTPNALISGSASATVQDYITVDLDWENLEQAIELDQLDQILMPAGEECINALETSLGAYMVQNAGLSYGSPGTVVNAWSDVVGAGSLMQSIGVPMTGDKFYVMNPFVQSNLAIAQTGLTAADSLVRTAWEQAQISSNFGGFRSLSCNSLSTYTTGTTADRSGTLGATPTATYTAAKDTMTQTLILDGLTIGGTVSAGETLLFTTANRTHLNIRSRVTAFDDSGAAIQWRCRVVTGGTADGAGDNCSVTVANAAINDATGQYDNITSALTSGDVFTVLGVEDTVYQPNLFFHRDAFAIETVNLPRLAATEGSVVTKDGFAIRFTRYSDGDTNVQKARFDLLPVFGTLNPLFAGHGYGVP